MRPELTPVTVDLTFRLGEITLGKKTLAGVADRRHFTRLQVADGLPSMEGIAATEDFVFFPRYPVSSALPPVGRAGRWVFYTPYTFRNYYVNLRQFASFEKYLEKFSSKSRQTLRRKVKKFAEGTGGEARWRCYRTPAELREFLDLARPLSMLTYQDRLLGVGLPVGADFDEEVAEKAAADKVIAALLFAAARPAAYALCFVEEDIATYDFVGFDPEFQTTSPGTVLQFLILERLFAEGRIGIFDFTEGEGAQKQFFATDHCLCAKTYALRATFPNRLLITLHRGANAASESIGEVLQRLGVKAALKRLIRRSA